jgi:hypothetical protein
MKKPKNNVNALLAAIQRTATTTASAGSSEGVSQQPSKIEALPNKKPESSVREKTVKVKRRVGKPVQFWMHDEERKLVRELSAWIAGQGIRPSDSMVIRATLRFAKTGGAFLEAYHQAAQMDGRLKHD